MSYIDIFKSETKQRNIYGTSGSTGIKVLILSYFLQQGVETEILHKLLGLYSKYNRGSKLTMYAGTIPVDIPSEGGEFVSETISKTLTIPSTSLSGIGTIEEQISEYINNNNITKSSVDAELWVEVI